MENQPNYKSMTDMAADQSNLRYHAKKKSKGRKFKWDVALDPSYPDEEVKEVSDQDILKAFGLTQPVRRLNKALGEFGLGVVQSQMTQQLRDFVELEEVWAQDVHYWWWATAPYETTNLRHAITIDDSRFPKKIDVKIDRNLLLQFSGFTLKGWRTNTVDTIPSRNYLRIAEKHNVSAADKPGGERHPIPDFVSSVWEEYANKHRRELFV